MSGREIATVGAPLGVPFVVIAVFLLLAGPGRRRDPD
jgi:hypothetical protein